MIKRMILFSIFINCVVNLFASENPCNLTQSAFSRLYTVNVEDVICLAQNSDKDITIFFTYANWCAPCRKKVPEAIKLAKEYDADFYLLFIDRERDSFRLGWALQISDSVNNNQLKMAIISDDLYDEKAIARMERRDRRAFQIDTGRLAGNKYRNFLTQITPPEFENINDMGKFIVLNKNGDVLLVTNYKDNAGSVKGDYSVLFEKITRILVENKQNN
jgi:thiol-disulfide isomerase/thioredoxin